MEINNNTVRLVRALVKLSSALYNIDDLKIDSRYKYKLKQDLENWQPWLEGYIDGPMTAFANADMNTLSSLIEMFDDYNKKIFIKDDFNTGINLFLAKTASALYDISTLEPPYQNYMSNIRQKITKLLEQGYFKAYTNYEDANGKTFKDIVQSMNDLGDKIIVGTV
jgi:hypothetical protein